ncbi:unnamed protein product [Nippostrongylus brasiliensis]|uniref:Apple domain-containing protein n=1 Tax=Nippostrongylus brasiliensis TaxID=27835 RepID=A0A0N4YJQ3_NIPBR|nr:unnamed protein product [Nippostrongylus brasiliensis]
MALSPINPFSECAGAVQFVVSSNVDEETVELLLNETTVSSGNECAQLCFDLKCGFAYYEPTKKLCRLSADTEHVVDASGCSSNDDFKSIVPEEKPVQITCVSSVTSAPIQFVVDSPASVQKAADVGQAPALPSTRYPGKHA